MGVYLTDGELLKQYTKGMGEENSKLFVADYESAKKNELVNFLLCFFLGVFGIHRFYLGSAGMGVLYLLAVVFSDSVLCMIYSLSERLFIITTKTLP